MYEIGEYVIYGNHGVSRVEAVGTLETSTGDKERLYYTLSPVYQDGKIFTPIDTNVFMRPVITCIEVQRLIELYPSIVEKACGDSNFKLMEGHYKESIGTHECSDLIQIIKTINTRKRTAESQKKKLSAIDERFIKLAEDMLYGEFAVVLGISKDKIKEYIYERVVNSEKRNEI